MNSAFPWIDLIFGVLLVFGILRGRKRGMSLELLSVLEVLVIVVVGSQVYEPLGQKLAEAASGSISLLLSYVIVYVLVILLVHMIFGRIKTAVGEKLVGSDVFGSMEYYFGMLAGLLRYAGIIVIFLALMNARAVDAQREAELQKIQRDNFGSISFPTFGTIQSEIFNKSYAGNFARKYLEHLLIKPTQPGVGVQPPKETIGKRRQHAVDEIIGTPKPK